MEPTREDDPPPSVGEVRSFGRRALLGATSPIETFHLDQAAVALFLAPISLGYYVVAVAFTNLPRFIGQAIGLVANPYVARRRGQDDAIRMMWKFTFAGAAVLAPLIVALWLSAPVLVEFFFGEEFSESIGVVRILLVGSLFYGIRRVLSDAARGAGYPLAGSIAEVLSVGAAIALFPILIPWLGLDGAAYALLAASVVALVALVIALVRPGSRPAPPAAADEAPGLAID